MKLVRFVAAPALLLLALSVSAQDRMQTRSMVISRGGIVAAENPLAAQAGAEMLAGGGNAVDAAVTTNAVMGVVEPMMNGLGGDLFVIVYDAKTQKLYGLNASGWAPAGLSIDFLKSKGIAAMPSEGIQSVTIPGVVDGWSKLLARFGTKGFSQVLSPAIYYAREGFPVPEWDAAYWNLATLIATVKSDPNAAKLYLPGGRPPQVGDIFRNPDLAHSLEAIAGGGRDAFYKGESAQRIVAHSTELGGTLKMEDFASYLSEWVNPISTDYRGWTIYEIPPNGQGIAALEMLNILEKFPLGNYGANSADALHTMIEAKKLAYADLVRYIGDPKFSDIPVVQILSKPYARAARFADRYGEGKLQCPRRRAEIARRWRHDLSHGRRQRRKYGVADSEQLSGIWLGRCCRWHRIRSTESRRPFQPRSEFAERARRPQTATTHDHSRLHGQGG
jgi:gamma-glutamyltranspeptidase/glutathione hydrolase